MADLSAFHNDQFNCVSWLNSALKEKSDEENVESYLASLAMKLHMISQDYSDQLETGMVEAISTMPRIQSEIMRLEDLLTVVDNEMTELKSQLQTLDQRNVVGIEDLSRLDMLKTNMENCKATLEEHARWSQLVREAKTFLEGGGRLSDSADRIEVMHRSLVILRNISGHEEREKTYHELRNTLLNAMRPQIRRDIAEYDLAPLQEYLYAFDKLGIRQELEDEYINIRLERLLKSWQVYCNGNIDGKSTLTTQSKFLAEVMIMIENESPHISALFGQDSVATLLIALLQRLFTAIKDSIYNGISVQKSPLIASGSFSLMDEVGLKMLKFMNCSSVNIESILPLLTSMFSSYLQYSELYCEHEAEHLKVQLLVIIKSIVFSSQASSQYTEDDMFTEANNEQDPYEVYGAYSEHLVAAADSMITPAFESMNRSSVFLGGFKIKQVFRSISSLLTQFVKELIKKIEELRTACGIARENNFPDEGSESTSIAEGWARKLETFDMGSKPLLQFALRSLQSTGRLSIRIAELEAFASKMLQTVLQQLFKDSLADKALSQMLKSSSASASTSSSLGSVYMSSYIMHDFSTSSELKSFLLSSQTSHTVFGNLTSSLSRCKLTSGSLLLDLCINIPEKSLLGLSSDDSWTLDKTDFNLDSLLPQSCFTQVGEHLLSLVQELENFASSDALQDLMYVLGSSANLVSVTSGWKALKGALDLSDETIDEICRRKSCFNLISAAERLMFGNIVTRLEDSGEYDQSLEDYQNKKLEPSDEDSGVALFVNEWLGASVDAVVGIITTEILGINKLTKFGLSQLVVNIEYISNVIQAMGLKQHPLLLHLHALLLRESATILSTVELMPTTSQGNLALHKINKKLGTAIVA